MQMFKMRISILSPPPINLTHLFTVAWNVSSAATLAPVMNALVP